MRLTIDRESPLPLHDQLTEGIRLLIDGSELEPGQALPTIKELAELLGVNANTVATAYRQLEREGYLTQRKRAGTSVASAPPRRLERILAGRLAAEVNGRARAAGLAPADLLRAIGADAATRTDRPVIDIAVLADSELRATELARRSQEVLGNGVRCHPRTPEAYVSVEFHLTIVDPQLTVRLSSVTEGRAATRLPSYLSYSPEFPAGAD